MGTPRIVMTEKVIAKRVKQGRGKGRRARYQPWIKVQDFSSIGRASRAKSVLFDRLHHVFSKLELEVLCILECLPCVWDIREQFPLPRVDTIQLAKEFGIRHPIYPDTCLHTVMTTDFLVTCRTGLQETHYAYAVKYASQAEKPRPGSKLKLEAAYWQHLPKAIPHLVVTDHVIQPSLVKNAQFVRPHRHLESLYPLKTTQIEEIEKQLTPGVLKSRDSLASLCNQNDQRLAIRAGSSLKVARYLMANQVWPLDWSRFFNPGLPLPLGSGYLDPATLQWKVA